MHTHTHNELKVTNHAALMYKNQKLNLSVNVLLETDKRLYNLNKEWKHKWINYVVCELHHNKDAREINKNRTNRSM